MLRFARRSVAALALAAAFIVAGSPARADVPSCFVEPPQPAVLVVSPTPPPPLPTACVLLAKLIAASDVTQLAWIPGRMLDTTLGVTTDAFPAGAYAVRFVVTPQFNTAFAGPDTLVRFANDDFSARVGSWWTVLETVEDPNGTLRDPAAIASVLALPPSSIPKMEATAMSVRPGTVGYFGLVAPAFGQPGGGVQFWFPGEPVYSKTAPLELPPRR
jgi:hypothetical protein